MNNCDIDELFDQYENAKGKVWRYVMNHLNNGELGENILHRLNDDYKKITASHFNDLIKKKILTKTNIKNICNYLQSTHNADVLLYNLNTNPFRFVYISTSPLIPFEKALHIAKYYDTDECEYEKEKAWVHEYITKNKSNNSFYVMEQVLMKDFFKHFDKKMDIDVTEKLCVKQVFNNKTYYTSCRFSKIEYKIADVVNNIHRQDDDYDEDEVQEYLDIYNQSVDFKLHDEQQQCVHKMLKNNFTIVSGLPGVGKSTIIDVYCEFVNQYNMTRDKEKIYIIAPTGMAVKNARSKIKNKSKVEACTIHKLIYKFSKKSHDDDENNKKETINSYDDDHQDKEIIHTIIVDESSMVDTLFMSKILAIVETHQCKLVLLGDNNQLPPIGMGTPFVYFLSCKSLPKMHLTHIHRQKECKLMDIIKQLVTRPETILIDEFDGKTIIFEHTKFYDKDTLMKNIITKYGICKENSKFISPCSKYDSGVDAINKSLQELYNPNPFLKKKFATISPKFGGDKKFTTHDIVLLTKNISNTNRVNGDFMKIMDINTVINKLKKEITKFTLRMIDTEEEEFEVDEDEMYDNYVLGYCCTVHKVQGSQYDDIIVIIDRMHDFQWSNKDAIKLLYTAISRAKNRCILVGNKIQFYKALSSFDSTKIMDPLTNIVKLIV